MKIRKASLKDVNAITEMVIGLADFEGDLDPGFHVLDRTRLEDFRPFIRKGVKGSRKRFVLVAEENGVVVGFIYCTIKKRPSVFTVKETGIIEDILVLPEFRKKGIAKKLVQETIKRFRKAKIKFVCVSALSNNKKALKAYQKLGFKEFKKELRRKI